MDGEVKGLIPLEDEGEGRFARAGAMGARVLATLRADADGRAEHASQIAFLSPDEARAFAAALVAAATAAELAP